MAGLPEDAHALGAWLADLRDAAQLTQAELGQAAGVATRTIQRWEAGTHAPVDVIRVLTALGVRLDPPEPSEVRAINATVAALEDQLRSVDRALMQAKVADGAPNQQELLARLEEVEAKVETSAGKTADSLGRLTKEIALLSARLPEEEPGTPRRGRGR
jgi:transcriptional regulator with XRE-family HTH domain